MLVPHLVGSPGRMEVCGRSAVSSLQPARDGFSAVEHSQSCKYRPLHVLHTLRRQDDVRHIWSYGPVQMESHGQQHPGNIVA